MKPTVIRYIPLEKEHIREKHPIGRVLLIAALIWFAIFSLVSGNQVSLWVTETARYIAETTGYSIAASASSEFDINVDKNNAEYLLNVLDSDIIAGIAVQTVAESIRNVSHFITFFLFFFAAVYIAGRKRNAAVALLFSVIFAVFSEVLQSLISSRHSSVIDIAHNLMGVGAAFLFFLIFRGLVRYSYASKKPAGKRYY